MKKLMTLAAAVALVACGGNNESNSSTDAGVLHDIPLPDNNPTVDMGSNPDDDGGSSGGGDMGGTTGDGGTPNNGSDGGTVTPGELPDVPDAHGVVYVGHLESTAINIYRTDGAGLTEAGSVDTGGPILDLALDRRNDLLFATHPADYEVSIWSLDVPADATTDAALPTELSRISFDRVTLTLAVDDLHDRLYVAEALPTPGDGSPQQNMSLHIIDVSDPASPTTVSVEEVPSTASWDIDPVRQVGFFFKEAADELYGYDLAGDTTASLGGPISLVADGWYPEDNQFAFQARNLTVDPYTNRLYAGRPMGTLSELIALEYPAAIPATGESYGDLAQMTDLTKLDDAFDVSVDPMERRNLLDAYQPVVDPLLDMVLMSAGAWNGMSSQALMISYLPGDIGTLGMGCGDGDEGFGCFMRVYLDGDPGSYGTTDGATCVDYENRVVVGTTYDPAETTNPGYLHAFRYSDDGTMAPFNSETGDSLTTEGYPVAIECH